MLSNVFFKSLRDQRRSLTYWSIGVALLSFVTVLFYPSISDAPELSELFSDSDAIARVFAGGFTDLTSPEGFLNSQLYSLLVPILFLIFGIAHSTGAIAGEEEKGTLDVLLSGPLSRSQVLIHKYGAMVVALLVLAFVLWLSVGIGALIVDMGLNLGRVAEVTVSGLLLGVLFGSIGLALGSATGKRGVSVGITGALAVTVYFVNALAPLVEGIEHAAKLSPFYYYLEADPLSNGLNLAHAGVLVVLAAVALAVAWYTFQRRDLAV